MAELPLHRLPRKNQTAVWWNRTGVDQFGQPTFAAKVQIDCRWEDSVEEFTSASGEKKISRAIVYPDRLLKPGDYLWEGELAGSPVNPLKDKFAWEIQRFDKIPDARAKKVVYVAYL